MNKRVKKLWLTALRSGKYKQATGTLRREAGDGQYEHCCLGVLCEIHRQHSQKPGKWNDDAYCGESATLPSEVVKWAKLPDNNPMLDAEGDCLAGLNDEGKDFNYIADRIEKYL